MRAAADDADDAKRLRRRRLPSVVVVGEEGAANAADNNDGELRWRRPCDGEGIFKMDVVPPNDDVDERRRRP